METLHFIPNGEDPYPVWEEWERRQRVRKKFIAGLTSNGKIAM
jgi:hypothetical protein